MNISFEVCGCESCQDFVEETYHLEDLTLAEFEHNRWGRAFKLLLDTLPNDERAQALRELAFEPSHNANIPFNRLSCFDSKGSEGGEYSFIVNHAHPTIRNEWDSFCIEVPGITRVITKDKPTTLRYLYEVPGPDNTLAQWLLTRSDEKAMLRQAF